VRHLALALAALLGALLIGFAASQPPAAKPAYAPADTFSALRAMADVRAIARAPRPTGSAENARVRAYLLARLRQLGMAAQSQATPLPKRSVKKLLNWGGPAAGASQAVNVIGVLAGRDRQRPAILLMAHYDSVWGSPGAADDAAGVAAALETVRAVKAQGELQRDLVVLFTDAEELGLVGAESFFERHPLAQRIGAVVNMESRGGGGRTAMFETGRGNGEMMGLYRRSVSRPSSNSLAVLIYELMPNRTDFTIPKRRGIAGFNFAFIGDARLYHSPASTPHLLDPATLQDLGGQALGVTRALAFAPALPQKAQDAVFGDVLGLFVIAYSPIAGWAVLAVSAALFAFAWAKVRMDGRRALGGAALALALLTHSVLLLKVANLLSGSGGKTNYYDRLAALPRLELQAACLCVAALALAVIAARPRHGLAAAAPAMLLTFMGAAAGGFSLILLGTGTVAALSALLVPARPLGLWAGWFGIAAPVVVLALATQLFAPTATPVLAWPLALCGLAMAAAAQLDPELRRLRMPALLGLLAIVGGGHTLYLAHFTFLGIGAKTPEVMALYALLFALLIWPLLKGAANGRAFAAAAGVLVIGAAGVALSVRLDPMDETVPPYSESR
jgi:hypothetical protein